MCKISIIIPVYNVYSYLRKCIESVLLQNFTDYEIIIVNDASPDKCDEIMREYEGNSKVKCIYLNVNVGLGGARNVGICEATGEYVLFLDSDDYIDEDYLSKMYAATNKSEHDLVFGAYRTVEEESGKTELFPLYPECIQGELTEEKKKVFLLEAVYAWGKLYKRKKWQSLNLKFPEKLKYEDAPTIPLFCLSCTSCGYAGEAYYNYLKRQGSIMSSRNSGHDEAQITTRLFLDRAKDYGIKEKYKDEVECFTLKRYCFTYVKRAFELYDNPPFDKIAETIRVAKEIYPSYEKNKYIYTLNLKSLLYVKLAELSPELSLCLIKTEKEQKELFDEMYISLFTKYYEMFMSELRDVLRMYKVIGIYGLNLKGIALQGICARDFNNTTTYILNDEDIKRNDFRGVDVILCVTHVNFFRITKVCKFGEVVFIDLDARIRGYC